MCLEPRVPILVAYINRDFSFIGQTQLASDTFASVGVSNFDTKIMVFLRKSEHIAMNAYSDKAIALITKFRHQHAPKDYSYEEFLLWDKNKLTTAVVLSVIRKYIKQQ